MGLFQSIKLYFSKYCETKENHHNPLLKTHYYKATKSNAMTVIQSKLSKLPGFKIVSVSNDHGEMGIRISSPKKAFVIISVVSVRPLETAVDLTITYEGLTSLGYNPKLAGKIYSELNKELVHIGNGNTNGGKR